MTRVRPRAVPVDVVRDHLAPFVDAGWPYMVIATAAGVSPSTVVNVMRRHRPKVKAGTAKVLTHLTWADLARNQHAAEKVPSVGSRRRIEALIWNGYTVLQIADASGIHHSNIDRILHGHRPVILARTAQGIDQAYRALWATFPATSDWKAARNATASRNRAIARGYRPALSWDDIDDPNAVPDYGAEPTRDLTPDELTAEVARLTRRGLSAAQIAHQLDVSERTVVRHRGRNVA